jgi:arsenite methyltransferase
MAVKCVHLKHYAVRFTRLDGNTLREDAPSLPEKRHASISKPMETSVKERYASAAHAPEAALCCPVAYDKQYLEIIPKEVIEKDYGCGDPSRYLHPGETVLDLGSGTGKICFIAAQVVGAGGKVIGVDMTDDMLEVAHRNAPIVAERLGYSNVTFLKGRIQDLALDLARLDAALEHKPVSSAADFLAMETITGKLRKEHPLVSTESIDVVVSNCVLNLVEGDAKVALFREIHRVIRAGGRAVISDIVSDEQVPEHMQMDPELWSGCISGALTEEGFLKAFEDAGFYGIEILKRDVAPWRTVEGIEFRSVTIQAFKGQESPRLERNQAVIYKGPFSMIKDDEGHVMERGKRYAVCDSTYELFRKAPYENHFECIEPASPIAREEADAFDDDTMRVRVPEETKGTSEESAPADCDEDGGSCCC